MIEIRPDPDPPEALGQEIRRLDPDFCLIQNIAVPFAEPWLNTLAAATGAHIVSGPSLVLRNGVTGLALLTRRPPVSKRFADLSLPPAPANGAMDLEFEIGGNTIRIVTARLSLRADECDAQVDHLYAMLARRARPALVLGRISAADLRRIASGRVHGRPATMSWSSRLCRSRRGGRVRIGSFPPCPLDAEPLVPPTPAMIAFEISAPPDSDTADTLWPAVSSPASVGPMP